MPAAADQIRGYDDRFFDWVEATSLNSARQALPLVARAMKVESVADIGCGSGAWLAVWNELGVGNVTGIDGSYVRKERLMFEAANFIGQDLRQPIALPRRFDLVQCLEVAEHLPESRSASLVDDLCRLSDVVLFSAAQRGQGGEFHINEQSLEFWRSLFAAHGYQPFDFLRPALRHAANIAPWYKYNMIVYAAESAAGRFSAPARSTRIEPGTPLSTAADWRWRSRLMLGRLLPQPVATVLSRLNYRARMLLQPASPERGKP